jgi:hypothetical protein
LETLQFSKTPIEFSKKFKLAFIAFLLTNFWPFRLKLFRKVLGFAHNAKNFKNWPNFLGKSTGSSPISAGSPVKIGCFSKFLKLHLIIVAKSWRKWGLKKEKCL